jgi:hypothetical protein
MKELTKHQIYRQDFVDNAIFDLIQKVNPSGKEIEWNIEMIGDVRDVIQEWAVDKLEIITEQDFYPYFEEQ